jgi:hypothetical protein
MAILRKLVQSRNAFSPIDVTWLGIDIDVKQEHPENKPFVNKVASSETITLFIELHPPGY